MATTNCITVLTARGITEILRSGGSQAWRINAAHAAKYKYLVCVQNSKIDWGTQEAKHHHAFLVGKISGISRSPEAPHKRWIINIDSYAEIDLPEQWDGNRNPVSYRSMEDMGIDIDKLEFKPVSTVESSTLSDLNNDAEESLTEGYDTTTPLSLKEAKAGLAMYFGVSEDDVQIVIKG